jgi:hypothetical protein
LDVLTKKQFPLQVESSKKTICVGALVQDNPKKATRQIYHCRLLHQFVCKRRGSIRRSAVEVPKVSDNRCFFVIGRYQTRVVKKIKLPLSGGSLNIAINERNKRVFARAGPKKELKVSISHKHNTRRLEDENFPKSVKGDHLAMWPGANLWHFHLPASFMSERVHHTSTTYHYGMV